MTSQTRQQIITIHKLSNISRSKGNEAMKFGQIVKYSARNVFFFKTHTKNEPGRLVSDLFLLFKRALHQIKAIGQHLSFNIFW